MFTEGLVEQRPTYYHLVMFKKFAEFYHLSRHNLAVNSQEKKLIEMVGRCKETAFGRDHHFSQIHCYKDFKERVPVRHYDDFSPYFEHPQFSKGAILWPGPPQYFAKTSGSSGGVKYIPITQEIIKAYKDNSKKILWHLLSKPFGWSLLRRKWVYLTGQSSFEQHRGVKASSATAILNQHSSHFMQKNRIPSVDFKAEGDWNDKIAKICEQALECRDKVGVIFGVPVWIVHFCETVLQKTGKKAMKEVFPKLNTLIVGGQSITPYQMQLQHLMGQKWNQVELYGASEGLMAYGGADDGDALWPNVDSTTFFEFIALDDFQNGKMDRVMLKDVVLNTHYVVIISTMAGLWAYNLGDTVKFVSLSPYKLKITGRVNNLLNMVGEQFLAEEAEWALANVSKRLDIAFKDFTIAPGSGQFHDWYIESEDEIDDILSFAGQVDTSIGELNPAYKILRDKGVLKMPQFNFVKKGTFNHYMKSNNKMGEQFKIPRVVLNRQVVDAISSNKIV